MKTSGASNIERSRRSRGAAASNRRFGAGICLALICAVLIGSSISPAQAGIAEAKKLLADKNYSQVDRALGGDLRSTKPSSEALKISLDAAIADGRFVTAQRRVTALLKKNGNDLKLVFQGAEIAKLACKDSLAMSRYLDYAQRQNTKSDNLRYALAYVSANGKFPQQYKKYIRLYGRDEISWKLGTDLLGRLITDSEITPTFDVAQTLLDNFRHPKQVYEVHRRLQYAIDNNRLGSDPQNAYVLPMKFIAQTIPSNYDSYSRILGRAASKISKDELLEILFTHQQLAKKPLPSSVFGYFREIANLGSDEKKLTAGRKFLALEPIYRKSTNLQEYKDYISVLADNTGVFAIKGKEILPASTAEGIIKAISDIIKKSPDHELDRRIHDLASRYITAEKRKQITRQYALKRSVYEIRSLLPNISTKDPNRAKLIAQGKSEIAKFIAQTNYTERAGVASALMAWYSKIGDKASLIAAAKQYMDLKPDSFNEHQLRSGVFGSKLLSTAEKFAIVRDQLTRAGAGHPAQPMGQLIRNLDKESKKAPEYKALINQFKANKPGTDVLSRYVLLTGRTVKNRRNKLPRAEQLASEFLSKYKGSLPLGAAGCKTRNDVLAYAIMRNVYHGARSGLVQTGIAKKWMARAAGPGTMLPSLAKSLSAEEIQKVLSRIGGAIPSGDPMWAQLASIPYHGETKTAPLAKFYKKMGPESALRHVATQMGLYTNRQGPWKDKPEVAAGAVAKLVGSGGFRSTDANTLALMIGELAHSSKTAKVAEGTLATLWVNYLQASDRSDWRMDLRTRCGVLQILASSGKTKPIEANVNDLASGLGRMGLSTQAQRLEYVCGILGLSSERDAAKAGPYTMVIEKLAAVYARMSDSDWILHSVSDRIINDMSMLARHGKKHRKLYGADGRLSNATEKIHPLLIERFALGARPSTPSSLGRLTSQIKANLDQAVADSQWRKAVQFGALYFRAMPQERTDWDNAHQENIVTLAKTLTKAQAWEVVYTTLERMRQARPREAVMKALARYRTQAANKITGVVAVARGDKTYHLHMAARVLSLGDESKAWQLTRTRTNLMVESWSSFEPQYVAWCIEQMRKNKMLKEALELAFTVLLRENDLEPEIAAEVLLTRGDIYRDRKNFDVARIEYKALKDNTRYRKTAAGIRATYHLVNLMITTGQYSTAQRLIERLIDSVDLTVKAEGYFLRARLAFEQKDYETAAENIDKVRLCVNDHVEAAFLDGQLKLKLPGGMINPEVEVGTAATRRILIPGEELALKLQDANLSIARDEKTIPILVRTTSGKDEERVDLLSLAGGKNLFTGTLRTALGAAKPGSGILEVTGADRVTYMIAPDFQLKNKIDYPPKYLDIRTVGKLVASAGKILTPEQAEKQRLEAALGKPKKAAPSTMVRPGNDIYLQVYDVDQDVTSGADKVTVKLTTTNGDVIEAVELTESDKHSGAFRGSVKTGLPLPKAYASDTFEGKKPSALINSTLAGDWSSLADGEKPKAVGVDMMGSHIMKTITAELPQAGSAKAVELQARLAKEFQTIATYPILGVQKGLRAEYFSDVEMTKPAGEKTVTELTAKVEKGILAVRYSGVFVAAASGQHTFKATTDGQASLSIAGKEIIALKTKTFAGKATITVDDSTIAGKGETPFVLVYIPSEKQANLSVTVAASKGPARPINLWAMHPGGQAQRRDELAVQYANLPDGKVDGAALTDIVEYFAQKGPKGTIYRPTASYTAPANAEWGVVQMTGYFYVPKARYMTLRLTGKSFDNPESWGNLLIDDKIVLKRAKRGKRDEMPELIPAIAVKLTKGVHKLSATLFGRKTCDIAVTYKNVVDEFEPMDARWFSTDHNAELIPAVSPAGHIGVKGNQLVCELTKPQRLREIRWIFNDYEGGSVAVKRLGIVDADNKVLIPVKKDFTSATTNSILEIAPGDTISAHYIDVKRPEGGSPDRRASLSTGYYNGSIVIANEMVTDTGSGMKTTYFPAKRCGVGDALAILIGEADKDTTPKRDVMKVLVETSSGQKIELDALETEGEVETDATGKEVETHHTGNFLALLRLGKEAAKGTIKVMPGDLITVSYMDVENSDPGVAFQRKYELYEGGDPLVEEVNFERYTSSLIRQEVKDDPDAILKGREENAAPKFAYKHMLIRTDAPQVGAEPDALPVTSIRGPLRFTIMYPAMAKNTASVIDATVWAESEIHAATAAKREPTKLSVKAACGTGGLDDGVFTGEVKLLVGLPGQDAELASDPALAILDTISGQSKPKRTPKTSWSSCPATLSGSSTRTRPPRRKSPDG
jgi:hypothetical protein